MSGPKTAIVGIGATEQGELPGRTADELAVEAAALALADAGISKLEVDGIVTCKPPGPPGQGGVDENVAFMLGINPAFSSTLEYGACGFSLHLAASAIEAGLASTVLLTYGTNARSGKVSFGRAVGGDADWFARAGFFHVAGPASMAFRRHMARYGTTEEQLGWVSVAQREWAALNPRAIMRKPVTIDEYMASSYFVEPLRRNDLALISDGGAAVVLTKADRVSGFRTATPVYLRAMAQQSAMRNDQNPGKLDRPWLATIADKVYAQAGMRPADVNLAYFQDATSVWVLQMLEAYGFCAPGEGGPFLAEGHTRPGGSLPVNTNGGQLSEAYMWNWLHLVEAVVQLRGEAGARQVAGAEVALHAQTHDFFKGAATLLSNRSDG